MAHVTWSRRPENAHIAEIVMQRPEVFNAFNTAMAKEFIQVCREIQAAEDIRVVGLRSSEAKAFCSGADLKERKGMTDAEWKDQHRLFEIMFYGLADLPMPTIAVIDGFALAGGMELALNCDMWIVSERAVFGLPEVTRGIMPGGGGTRLLTRRVGVHKAKEIILSGRKYSAEEIAAMGLANRLVSPDKLDEAFLDLAAAISVNAPLAVRYCKAALEELMAYPDLAGREREIFWYNKCIDTEDRLEGVLAFNEKRPPRFRGK